MIYYPRKVVWKQFSTYRSSHRRCFVRKGVLINSCNFIKKETLTQVFSCEFCEISKNTFSTQHLWTTASILTWNLKSQESYLNSHGDTYFFRNVFKQTSVLSRYHNYKNNMSSTLPGFSFLTSCSIVSLGSTLTSVMFSYLFLK